MFLTPSAFHSRLPNLVGFGVILMVAWLVWACTPSSAMSEATFIPTAAPFSGEVVEMVDELDDDGVFPPGLTSNMLVGLVMALAHIHLCQFNFDPPPLLPPPQTQVIGIAPLLF